MKISAPEAAARIFYTPDGTEASEKSTQYTQPLTVAETSGVKAISVGKAGRASFAAESRLNRMPHDWDVKLFSVYNRQYTGDGVEGLIDGLCGTTNFASGEWQGCQAQDFVTVIDLQRETEIEKLGAGFLQVARSRIRMSTRIEFEISGDNENFRQAAEIKSDVAAEDMEHKIRDYVQNIAPARARYV